MKKYICIHGHFYQPPRENAWLDVIENQPDAAPYHDWNEKISAECYTANAYSRILSPEKRITKIVNNYSDISYNFGPTLLSWIEKNAPEAYQKIKEADIISISKNEGSGNAIAQVYNHIIMPLANTRDKETQILWGIKDFEYHFGRKPEGMWLSEAAVDIESLDLMAKHGINFTILSPGQASAYKLISDSNWIEITDENAFRKDLAYVCKLPSGRVITIFFYDGELAKEVAFNGLLHSGKKFASSILAKIKSDEQFHTLFHFATDGESYGHHHKHGEMALADCIAELNFDDSIQLINYSAYLKIQAPVYEVRIKENTSWSCVHGIERWRNDCGCTDGANSGFHQKWRAPLRNALNWLNDQLSLLFQEALSPLVQNVWDLRNDYIEYILQRNAAQLEKIISSHFRKMPDEHEIPGIIRLLEMQRHCMLMFTSCGWFFDDVSRIETKQILQYADRAIQIAESESGMKFYDSFLKLLSQAPSNIKRFENAAVLYEKEIRPHRLTLTKVGMHYAALSLFKDFQDESKLYCFTIESEFLEKYVKGVYQMSLGKAEMKNNITLGVQKIQFCAIHLGQLQIFGGYSENMESDVFEEMFMQMRDAFKAMNLKQAITLIQKYFNEQSFSFKDLFRDDQREVLEMLLKKEAQNAELTSVSIYEKTSAMLDYMKSEKMNLPDHLSQNITLALQAELKNYFQSNFDQPSKRLDLLTQELLYWKISVENSELIQAASNWLQFHFSALEVSVSNIELMEKISHVLLKLHELQLPVRLFEAQNIYFTMHENYVGKKIFMQTMKEQYSAWLHQFKGLGEQLNIRIAEHK